MAVELKFLKSCGEDWSAMAGGERERFCAECQRRQESLSLRRRAEFAVGSRPIKPGDPYSSAQ
jgi:hypothetical protein